MGITIRDDQGESYTIVTSAMDYLRMAAGRKKYGGMDLFSISPGHPEAIEVKVDCNCNFLHRDRPESECFQKGMLGFELWSNKESYSKGWVHGYMYPEEHTKECRERIVKSDEPKKELRVPESYCKPTVFIYLLAYEVDKKIIPYAAISFENVDELLNLLNKETNGDLMPQWNIERNEVRKKPYRSHIFQNMLYVPIEKLLELDDVTVTVFDDAFPTADIVRSQLQENQIQYWDNKQKLYKARAKLLHDCVTNQEERDERQKEAKKQIIQIDRVNIDSLEEFSDILQWTDDEGRRPL